MRGAYLFRALKLFVARGERNHFSAQRTRELQRKDRDAARVLHQNGSAGPGRAILDDGIRRLAGAVRQRNTFSFSLKRSE